MTDDGTGGVGGTGAGIVGVGAAACAACCAGPILGVLSTVGVATAAGYLVAGMAAIVAGIVAAAWLVNRRRRQRQQQCEAGPVTAVATPVIRHRHRGHR